MMKTYGFGFRKLSNTLRAVFFSLALASCGGNSSDSAASASLASKTTAASTISTAASPLLKSLALTYPNGQLPAERAAEAFALLAQNPAALKYNAAIEKAQLINPQAATASFAAVQRAQNTSLSGSYFFSIYPSEMTNALTTNPTWNLEGTAFFASLTTSEGLAPVHRFRNLINGSYLYTINEGEKNDILANYSAYFVLEGPAWYASPVQAAGFTPLYRFRNLINGTYLFSSYEAEKDAIVANYADIFKLEGVSYYVRQAAPRVAINLDTGISASQCYQIGSNVLVNCTSAGALALNDSQDGMVGLDVIEANNADGKLGFSYEAVNGGCVKDKRTGLTWEVKAADGGLRDMNKIYTNYDNVAQAQKKDGSTYVNPTAAEIAAVTNTVGFVAAVNATSMCGYLDWRLPTIDELQGIADYGAGYPNLPIDTNWFPNTLHKAFWSSSPVVGAPQLAWYEIGGSLYSNNDREGYLEYFTVRLVRGESVNTTSRYSYSAGGSEVIDSKTGLTWQRCALGMAWTGSTCTGIASGFSHEQALVEAKHHVASSGKAWRLPNVKELSSIADKTRLSPAIDPTVFPATPSYIFWSSTPESAVNTLATVSFYVSFVDAGVQRINRDFSQYVRLVRASQ